MEHMSTQPAFEAHFPSDRPLTWEDLQSIPDDQHWAYELVEGALLVSPAPGLRHQRVVLELAILLRDACPPDLEVVISPFDYVPRAGYALQPDVLVVERGTADLLRADAAPRLAVEVLSPSSRLTDRSLKRLVYEERGFVVGPESFAAQALFPVEVVPARLAAG